MSLTQESSFPHSTEGLRREETLTGMEDSLLAQQLAVFQEKLSTLQAQLQEAQETLDAIRSGDVDAVLVNGPNGQRVYTLENADRPYRVLIEKMQEGAVTLTRDGLILYCNQTFARMVARPVERVIGGRFQALLSDEDSASFDALLQAAGKGELRVLGANGQEVQTFISFSELPDEDGRILCAVVTDISLHKLRMRELADKNQRLQKEISERERTEETLRQAQKMEAVGQLTGGLAHDFNNLLTVISGNLQLLAAKMRQDERLSKYVQNALSATERGASLTKKLLAFSRRQSLKSEALRVNDLLAGLQMLAGQIIGVDITLTLLPGDNLWHCRADANQLESALLNLVINARDAMPSGGQLTISTENVALDVADATTIPDAEPGRYVKITVMDTGVGIPQENLGRVFEPFFTTKEIGKGSGLGLSMVYGFVRQTNGFITLESELSRGTRVSLYLPYTEVPVAGGESSASCPLWLGLSETAPLTALAVEDDLEVLKILEELLTELGFRVLSATNAHDALDLLEKTPGIQLLLTDVVMPGGVTGVDLARKLAVERPKLPVVLISGFMAQPAEQDEALSSEFQILYKPYQRRDLVRTIQNALERKGLLSG
jgi:PAS domain S-box-containing protein